MRRVLTVLFFVVSAFRVSAATNFIEIFNNRFAPATATVNVADTVTWIARNSGHDTTSVGGLWASGRMSFQQRFSFTFNSAGEFPYFCTPHQSLGMVGTITVQRAANAPPVASLTSPQANKVIAASGNVALFATATDDVSVAQVEFFKDGVSIGVDMSAPYELTDLSLSPGIYGFWTVARDNMGATGTSSNIQVRVAVEPRITSTTWDGATLAVTASGTDGIAHDLEATADFVNWSAVETRTSTGGVMMFTNTPGPAIRFYRLVAR